MVDNILANETFGPIDDELITCKNKTTGKPCFPVNHANGYFYQYNSLC